MQFLNSADQLLLLLSKEIQFRRTGVKEPPNRRFWSLFWWWTKTILKRS